MSDLETLLRSTLAERAAQEEPRPDAIRAAVAAVERRRRIRSTAQALAGAAAVGGIVLAGVLWHPLGPSATPAGPTAATPTSTLLETATATPNITPSATAAMAPPTPGSTETTDGVSTVAIRRIGTLTAVMGADWTAQPQSPSGFGGDITLTPGSPSATGLPAGYAAAASSVVLGPTSQSATGPEDTMTALCAALVEKGATTKACVPQQVHGLTVQRSATDAPNTKIGTWANLRILYQRPDRLVVYTEITIWNTAHTTTAEERATAAKWLHAQTAKLAAAATTGP